MLKFSLFSKSQTSTQITFMSDLEDTLMMCKWDAKTMSLKMWVSLITSSITLEVIGKFIFSKK